jgi:tRNA threonylcarbamoyladenosine biosynthesis protein TsaE
MKDKVEKSAAQTICRTAGETFALGEKLGRDLRGGEVVLLFGDLGAGKTLLTKGIVKALGFDVDEVSSPSFTLVNLYKAPSVDVYHIDLWRLDEVQNAGAAVGLEEILESSDPITIIEWADRLTDTASIQNCIRISIEGEGDEPRNITVERDPVEIAIQKEA